MTANLEMQEITDLTFEKEVLKADKPVVIDNWANWCQPCLLMVPIFEELSKEMKNVKFVKLNVDENQETASRYNIMSIPTFLIFKNGKEVERIIGSQPKPSIREKIEKAIKK